MKSEALLKEHEVRRRDLLILKYDKQRSLCDEIIMRQQKLIEGMTIANQIDYLLFIKQIKYLKCKVSIKMFVAMDDKTVSSKGMLCWLNIYFPRIFFA